MSLKPESSPSLRQPGGSAAVGHGAAPDDARVLAGDGTATRVLAGDGAVIAAGVQVGSEPAQQPNELA